MALLCRMQSGQGNNERLTVFASVRRARRRSDSRRANSDWTGRPCVNRLIIQRTRQRKTMTRWHAQEDVRDGGRSGILSQRHPPSSKHSSRSSCKTYLWFPTKSSEDARLQTCSRKSLNHRLCLETSLKNSTILEIGSLIDV